MLIIFKMATKCFRPTKIITYLLRIRACRRYDVSLHNLSQFVKTLIGIQVRIHAHKTGMEPCCNKRTDSVARLRSLRT